MTYIILECYYSLMLKKILCILSVFVILPAFSGELEDAAKIHDKIFLYLYTKDCSYCVKFNPVYNNISKSMLILNMVLA